MTVEKIIYKELLHEPAPIWFISNEININSNLNFFFLKKLNSIYGKP